MTDPIKVAEDILPVPQAWKPWVLGAIAVVAVWWLIRSMKTKSTALPGASISNAGNAPSSVNAMSSRPSAEDSGSTTLYVLPA